VVDEPRPETIEGVVGGALIKGADCTWLETSRDGRFDVFFPVGWTWTFEPLSIRDPSGREVLTEGSRARLTGTRGEIGGSPCGSGPLFDVVSVDLESP
jgi:hypothetical protein